MEEGQGKVPPQEQWLNVYIKIGLARDYNNV